MQAFDQNPTRVPFETDYLFTYQLRLDPDMKPNLVGEVNTGVSLVFTVDESLITGPRINGHFFPSSKDRMVVSRNGVSSHEVRSELLTNDGAVISYNYEGRGFWENDGYANLLRGVLPERVRIVGAPYLQSSHPDYQWVNRLQCFCVGDVYASREIQVFDVYAHR